MNDLIPRLDISRLIVKDLNGEIKESEKARAERVD